MDYVLELKRRAAPEKVICLKGNHEAMFLNFLQGRDLELFLYNGGISTLRDYWGEDWERLEQLVLPPEHRKFFEGLRLYYETPDYLFVHGGLKPGFPRRSRMKKTCCGSGGISSPPWKISARR